MFQLYKMPDKNMYLETTMRHKLAMADEAETFELWESNSVGQEENGFYYHTYASLRKKHKETFPSENFGKAKNVLGFIYSDLCGPF